MAVGLPQGSRLKGTETWSRVALLSVPGQAREGRMGASREEWRGLSRRCLHQERAVPLGIRLCAQRSWQAGGRVVRRTLCQPPTELADSGHAFSMNPILPPRCHFSWSLFCTL